MTTKKTTTKRQVEVDKMERKATVVRVAPDTWHRLKIHAAVTRRPMWVHLDQALTDYLKRHEDSV